MYFVPQRSDFGYSFSLCDSCTILMQVVPTYLARDHMSWGTHAHGTNECWNVFRVPLIRSTAASKPTTYLQNRSQK